MYSIMYSCIFNIFYGVLEVWKTVFKIKYIAWGICTRILLHNSVPVLYSMVYVHLYHPYYIPWCTAVPEVWETVFKIESTAGRLCTRTLLHNFTQNTASLPYPCTQFHGVQLYLRCGRLCLRLNLQLEDSVPEHCFTTSLL